MQMSDTQTKVAEIKTGMASLSRHIENIADGIGQLQSRQSVAQRALEATASEKDAALRFVADHCPSPEAVEEWRTEATEVAEKLRLQLNVVAEEMQKHVDVESTRVRHGGQEVS